MLQKIVLFMILSMIGIMGSSHAAVDTSKVTSSFIDPACVANQQTTSSGTSTYTNKRLSTPTFLDLKVDIQNNLTKFLTARITATNLSSGTTCSNPLSDSTCTVLSYANPADSGTSSSSSSSSNNNITFTSVNIMNGALTSTQQQTVLQGYLGSNYSSTISSIQKLNSTNVNSQATQICSTISSSLLNSINANGASSGISSSTRISACNTIIQPLLNGNVTDTTSITNALLKIAGFTILDASTQSTNVSNISSQTYGTTANSYCSDIITATDSLTINIGQLSTDCNTLVKNIYTSKGTNAAESDIASAFSSLNIQYSATALDTSSGTSTTSTAIGTAVTTDDVYQYVVYSALYEYIDADILDNGQLETIRAAFAAGYSNADSRTFEVRLKAVIDTVSITGTSLNNKSIADVLTIMDNASTKIAESISTDSLFFQKRGYSSLVAFPITSRLMECLDGTFSNLFMRDIDGVKQTPFRIAQDYFKPIVILALILYFVAYGYKIMMAHGMGKQSEMFMFAVKFGLVFYFSVGDAWKDFGLYFLKAIPATVAQIVFEALPSASDGCTVFKAELYPQGKGILAFFDTIDCKYANYIGLPSGSSIPGIFSIITIPLLIPIPIIGILVTSLATIYLSMVTYGILAGIEVYISSIIFLTFYLFLSPIVIPMALFDKTDEIYKAFEKKIMGCVVQGIMAIILIVTIMSLMDQIIYGDDPAGNKMFTAPSQATISGIPQPNKLNSNCYPGNTLGVTGSGGVGFMNAVPIACMLAKIANAGVTWIGFPVPYILEVFELPVGGGAIKFIFPFIVPALMAIIMLFIIQTVMNQTKDLADKISGMTSVSSFGAAKYNAMTDIMKKGKEVVGEAKETGKAAVDLVKKVAGGGGGG